MTRKRADFASLHALMTRHYKRGAGRFQMTRALCDDLIAHAIDDDDAELAAILQRGIHVSAVKELPPIVIFENELLDELLEACGVDTSVPQFKPGDGKSGTNPTTPQHRCHRERK